MPYFERDLNDLAASDPDRLISLVSSGQLERIELTWAAEALGHVADSARVVPMLLSLLKHDLPIVREGALYGLAQHHKYAGVRDAVRFHTDASNEPSAAIREIAGDIMHYIQTYGA
jgi:hypothetical protein